MKTSNGLMHAKYVHGLWNYLITIEYIQASKECNYYFFETY